MKKYNPQILIKSADRDLKEEINDRGLTQARSC